ncbi:hypothetical protein ACN2AU_09740, partial [Aerococcus viridans]
IIGNPSLNHRYRKGFYSLFKTLQQNHLIKVVIFCIIKRIFNYVSLTTFYDTTKVRAKYESATCYVVRKIQFIKKRGVLRTFRE